MRRSAWRRTMTVVLDPPHLRRTLLIALVVGSWLTVINLGDQWWQGPRDGVLCLRSLLNMLTPFVVANLGLLARKRPLSADRAACSLP
jgi:hypothetical protein